MPYTPVPTGEEATDSEWEHVNELVRVKSEIEGAETIDEQLDVLRRWWQVAIVETGLEDELKAERIAKLEAAKASAEQAVTDLDQQIRDERGTTPAPAPARPSP